MLAPAVVDEGPPTTLLVGAGCPRRTGPSVGLRSRSGAQVTSPVVRLSVGRDAALAPRSDRRVTAEVFTSTSISEPAGPTGDLSRSAGHQVPGGRFCSTEQAGSKIGCQSEAQPPQEVLRAAVRPRRWLNRKEGSEEPERVGGGRPCEHRTRPNADFDLMRSVAGITDAHRGKIHARAARHSSATRRCRRRWGVNRGRSVPECGGSLEPVVPRPTSPTPSATGRAGSYPPHRRRQQGISLDRTQTPCCRTARRHQALPFVRERFSRPFQAEVDRIVTRQPWTGSGRRYRSSSSGTRRPARSTRS